EKEYLRRISMVMGNRSQLIWDIPAVDSFLVNQAIYHIPDAQYRQTVSELTELLDLGALLNKQVRALSLGERMKCELAASLLHQPAILFLDEPTIGVDVTMQSRIRQFIAEYNRVHRAPAGRAAGAGPLGGGSADRGSDRSGVPGAGQCVVRIAYCVLPIRRREYEMRTTHYAIRTAQYASEGDHAGCNPDLSRTDLGGAGQHDAVSRRDAALGGVGHRRAAGVAGGLDRCRARALARRVRPRR